MSKARDFLGVGFRFPLGFTQVGNVKKLSGTSVTSDVDRIKNSLNHIFSVGVGERPMKRDFGCRIRNLLWQPINDMLDVLIDYYVRQAVERWEKRVRVTSVKTDQSNAKQGIVYIEVNFYIIESNVSGNFVFPFYLKEVDSEQPIALG